MISLGLDLSSKSGWATDAGDGTRPASGVWSLPWHGEVREIGPALLRLDTLMTECIRLRGVKICAIEEPFQFYGAKSAKIQLFLWNLVGTGLKVCEREGVESVIVQPARWRTLFLGIGNLKRDPAKEAAIAKCRELDWPAIDDNAAEACGIWAWLKCGNEKGWQAKVLGAAHAPYPKSSEKFWQKRARLGDGPPT